MDKRTDKKPAGFWRKNFPTLLYILCIPTKRWFLYCLGIFAILLCSDVTLAWWWRHVPISYQTTRITSPLRPDGTVDYIAALNQICGKDVTPDNNAVVDLLKAVGTNSIPDVVQADYLKLLGTQQTLLAQGKFESLDQFAREDKSYLSNVTPYDRKVQIDWLDDLDYDHALKTSEYPEVYKWIQSQQYSMALFKSASIRNYFYEPMVTSSPNGIGVPYIAFRNWTTGGKGGLFQKMFHFFQFRKDEFL
ncbi:MAG TPA: hypothetical protein VKJ65_13585, partial [Phycisphaerae bacterium]|nr:hypothetical protein [Phycisphaerae bacterium]